MSNAIQAILERRLPFRGISPWVFPGDRADQPVVNLKHWISEVGKIIEHEWTTHDLRRVYTTIAESMDLSEVTIKSLINHRQPGESDRSATGGYIVLDIERLRSAQQRITNEILMIAGIENNQ